MSRSDDTSAGPPALIWPERHIRPIAIFLGIITVAGLIGWVWNLENEIAPPVDGTINVTGATYGENCGLPKNNALLWVRSACSRKTTCDFDFNYEILGNPESACNKQFHIEWKCSSAGPILDITLPIIPAQHTKIPLKCP